MSHQAQVNYSLIASQCNSICEVAETKLAELDKMLNHLESTSTKLLNSQTESLKNEIKKERTSLQNQINKVRASANEKAKLGTVSVRDREYINRNQAIDEAELLKQQTNLLSTGKMLQYEDLIKTLLVDRINEDYRKSQERARGIITLDEDVKKLISSTTDTMLRQYIHLAYLEDNTLSGDALISSAKRRMNGLYESSYDREIKKIREELELARVEKSKIDKVLKTENLSKKEALSQIRENATSEIVEEKVRKKSLSIIKKAITERGFIVDKKNIKIDREKNEVILVGLKASGERATFKVYLDGKFIYDFHGYEGQACQKDIEPFMKDLEEVYGMKINKTEEIWSNPDKIMTMKYQAMNTNKNKG